MLCMNYLKSRQNKNITCRITLEAEFDDTYKPDILVDEFTNKFDFMNPHRKSSRSLWPDKELVGVKFETKDISGNIYMNKIKIDIHTYDFNKIYSKLSNWFEQTNVSIPDENKFYVGNIIINHIDDDAKVFVDSSKYKANETLQYTFKHDKSNKNIKIHNFMNVVYIEFTFLKIHIVDAIKCFDEIIEEEYIIVE